MTHVADSQLAGSVGASSLTATYRFLERLGHIAGPIVVAQLFLVAGQNSQVLLWIGMVVAVLGFLFVLPTSSGQGTRPAEEIAR